MSRPSRALAAALLGGSALVLAACTPTPAVAPSPTPTVSAGPTDAPPPPPPEPVLDGTAEDNKEFFDLHNWELINSGAPLSGPAFIDNLVAAGYERGAMEVTVDTTTVGVPADNVVFSIRFGEQCLLGQWGNIGYTSMIAPVLSTGRCIIGSERPA